jgi:hypothetical protein
VRDPPGEQAQALELLRLEQLRLEPLDAPRRRGCAR